jgi:hypothetical protein
VSRFESVAKICRRWQRRYRRKGFGRVLGKQDGDRRSESSIEKILGVRNELSAAKEQRGPPT